MKADALNWMTAIQSGIAASRRSAAEAGASTFTLPKPDPAKPDPSKPEPSRDTAATARQTLRDRDDATARAERADAKRDEAASRSATRDTASPRRAEDSASSAPVKRDTTKESGASAAQDASRPPSGGTARDPAPAARSTEADKAKSATDAEAAGTAVAQQQAVRDAVAAKETDVAGADDPGDEESSTATADATSTAPGSDSSLPGPASMTAALGLPPSLLSAQVQGQIQAQAQGQIQASAAPSGGVPGQEGMPAVSVTAAGTGRSAVVETGKAASAVSVGVSGKAGTAEAAGSAHAIEAAGVADAANTSDAAVPGTALPLSFTDHLGRTTATTATQATASVVPASPPTPLGSVPVEIGMRALAGMNRFDIRLDPIELGRIDVRLEIDKEKGAVKAHLTVDRPETLALLQRDTLQLGQALSQAGLTPGEGDINVSLRDTSQDGARSGGQSGGGGDASPRAGGGALAEADPVPQAAAWRGYAGTSGIDIRI